MAFIRVDGIGAYLRTNRDALSEACTVDGKRTEGRSSTRGLFLVTAADKVIEMPSPTAHVLSRTGAMIIARVDEKTSRFLPCR